MGVEDTVAAATGAWICVEDEAGQNLRPPRARTWARRGHTPVVAVSGKGSGRVSVAGLICLRPDARRRLFYRMRVHRGRRGERRSLSEADYAGLIAAAHNQLHALVIVVWDNLNTHLSAVMRDFTQAHPDWLTVIQLPAYAPDLNRWRASGRTRRTAWATSPLATPASWPEWSGTGLSASSTGPHSSTGSSPRPSSPFNLNRHRSQTLAFQPLYPRRLNSEYASPARR